jgi:hypothetical protein
LWLIGAIFINKKSTTLTMPKKCVICGGDPQYVIKDTSDAYCQECAIDCFNDTSLLLSVEEQAKNLKELLKEKTSKD